MRIDKFLWCIRFYKTRQISSEECRKNKVSINDQFVKPSREVIGGEIIKIKKNQIIYTLEIIQTPDNRVSAKLTSLYVKDLTSKEELEKLKDRISVQSYYREKGTGRPTKKDRREIDDFLNNNE